jgi:hypothetical protein
MGLWIKVSVWKFRTANEETAMDKFAYEQWAAVGIFPSKQTRSNEKIACVQNNRYKQIPFWTKTPQLKYHEENQ